MEALDLEKPNSLFNLINEEPDIDKIYLYVKDPYEEIIDDKIRDEKLQYNINRKTAKISALSLE